jgi:hypothetical protein
MKFTLPFLFVLLATPALAQVVPNPLSSKPMPTLAQCRADLDAWKSIDPLKDSKSTLTHDDLLEMVLEMSRCGFAVDTKNNDKYVDVQKTIQICISSKYYDFISRHRALWEQFEKEDAGGER